MPISSATEAVRADGRASAEWRGMLGMARDQPAFQSESRILKRMNAAVAIVLLAAPFAVLAALIAVLIVYLGNRTK
jgi:hypothetical protein